jgi:hypothetical protein
MTLILTDIIFLNIFTAWSTFQAKKYGNSYDFGDYLGCTIESTGSVSLKYCFVQYFDKLNQTISVPPSRHFHTIFDSMDASFVDSICIPRSCTSQDIVEILETSYTSQNLVFNDQIHCKLEMTRKYDFWVLNWLNWKRIL